VTLATQKIRLVLALRRAGITDISLLSAFEQVERETFVPEAFADQAGEDTPLPIGCGQTVSQPTVIARMIQALEPNNMLKVLEIGTGSGYQTALLSRLFRRVYTVERQPSLLRGAQECLMALRCHNVSARLGDGSLGWQEQAPFDRILVSAAAVDVPPVLWAQLAPGGLMVLPVGEEHHEQQLMVMRRTEGDPEIRELGTVRFLPLVAGRVRLRKAG
jgi:protein-L-isoaspartate(D-aspartate) O-methyltransferase